MKWKEWSEVARNEDAWRDHEVRGLLKAEHVRDYILRLWFEEDMDASIYELDFEPLIVGEDPGAAFLPLRDVDRFQVVEGEYALIWPKPETGAYDSGSVDLAPECVRYFCERYGREVKSPEKIPGSRTTGARQESIA